MTFVFHPGGRFYGPVKESREIAQRAKRDVNELQQEVDVLRSQLDRLYLITESMWFVMKEKLGLDDRRLGELVEEVDRRIQSFDGDRPAPGACERCQRPLSVRTGTCLYCGGLQQDG